MKKVILLDGNSIMFRAYYATAYTGNLMKTSNNLYTNAIYGFINMMNKILSTDNLTHIFVAFDKGKKTFRHQAYSEYKGGRKAMPEEFAMQIPYIKEYLDILNVKRLETDDYEADDLIGTMAKKLSNSFDEVVIISGDKDLLQMVGGNIKVCLTKKGITDLEEYNANNFKELMGFEPNQLIDYKGLIGDSSDNLPGISGVGPKTAIKLLSEYQTLESIIDHIDQLKGKLAITINEEKEQALKTKFLATLETNALIDVTEEDTILKKPDYKKLRSFFEQLEFNSFIKKMNFEDNNEIEKTNKKEIINKQYIINDLNKVIEALNNNDTISLDVEIDAENYHKGNLLGIGLVIDNIGYYLDRSYLFNDKVQQLLSEKIIYTIDAKKTYVSLKYLGIELNNIKFDVMLAAYVINPSYTTGDIKSVIEKFVETNLPYHEEVYSKKTKYVVPTEDILSKYVIDKCYEIINIKNIVDPIIDENNQKSLLYDLEIPLAIVLGQTEMNGFKVDEEKLQSVGKYFSEKMSEVEAQVYAEVGRTFNIASPKQLGVILFEELKLGKGKKNKTGYSTSAEILSELANVHIVPKLVLEYRKYAKLYSTYVVGLLEEVNQNDHKVHTIFKQALTQTGRLSSTEPNIQNIPVRTQEGRIIRDVFIPTSEEDYLVSADYSQIELRILASTSNCNSMIETFNQGVDLHASTAAKIYNVDIENVTKEMRRVAKAVNFGIVYGMSDWGLSEELHITPIEANVFIKKYFEVFPEIKPYLDNCILETKEKGYTTTIFNRRRYMPEINSSNGALRKFSERASMNAPIQGAAADIMKMAMLAVHNEFKNNNIKSKIVAQVHDELIIDCKNDELEKVKEILKLTMENVVNLNVSLSVDVEFGKTWDLK